MLHLLRHHRIHIPNGLAMFAALLLLVSSIIGFGSNQKAYSPGQDTSSTVQVESVDSVNDATSHKRRGINLGLLLFRR